MRIYAKPRKGFNNKYEIVDDYVIMYVKKQSSNEYLEVLFDLEDLQKLQKLNLPWHSGWVPNIQNYYIMATQRYKENGKHIQKTLYLNIIVTEPPEGMKVDHINHNTLDNRKSNLRIISNEENIKNRKSRNSNNTTGYRNVSYIKKLGKYIVQLQIDGTNKRLGEFDDVNEAGQFAEEMRKIYYGEFAGKG